MPTPRLNLDLLESFLAVAETRNFTRAAERLNCVQSAVSMQIRRLEDSLQTSLFKRSKRRVDLTDDGRTLLPFAHRIVRLQEQAVSEVCHQGVSGRVRLGASDTSMCYLPPVLEHFGKTYPNIDIELQCARSWDALDALEVGQTDLAFVTQKCGRKGGKRISRSGLSWAAAQGSNVDEHDPVPLAIFGPGCIYRNAALTALEKNGKAYRFAYESPSRAGLECAVAAGLAVTIVPDDCVPDGLRIIPPSPGGFPRLPEFSTYLFGQSSGQSPAVKAFATLLGETVARSSRMVVT